VIGFACIIADRVHADKMRQESGHTSSGNDGGLKARHNVTYPLNRTNVFKLLCSRYLSRPTYAIVLTEHLIQRDCGIREPHHSYSCRSSIESDGDILFCESRDAKMRNFISRPLDID
jgi:hypothetical protein